MLNKMNNKLRISSSSAARNAFTLIEALVAVSILLVIILFTSSIFTSVSKVATLGQANADAVAEIATFEEQIREDFANLSRDGFFVIKSRAVRNDVNGSTNPQQWLNPTLPGDAYIRSDQIVFFRDGSSSLQVFYGNSGVNRKPQSAVSRVYYGHGFQLGGLANPGDDVSANYADLMPWYAGQVDMVDFNGNNIQPIFIPQIPARKWTFARQNILLADDGGGTNVYLGQGASADTIWDNAIRNSRVDVAASQLNDIRNRIFDFGSNPWEPQRLRMLEAAFYPRAERSTPSTLRGDHALTTSVLGSAVSDFIVEWTYEHGTGFTINQSDEVFGGVSVSFVADHPWFGWPDSMLPDQFNDDQQRGVNMLAEADNNTSWLVDNNGPIDPNNFEKIVGITGDDVITYTAVFGYNQSRPLGDDLNRLSIDYDVPWDLDTSGEGISAYTPWPSAIRITMRVHDINTKLEGGRVVQFVVKLPKRTK